MRNLLLYHDDYYGIPIWKFDRIVYQIDQNLLGPRLVNQDLFVTRLQSLKLQSDTTSLCFDLHDVYGFLDNFGQGVLLESRLEFIFIHQVFVQIPLSYI